MTTYSELAITATDADFRRRVAYALTIAAVNVYAEGNAIAAHQARAAYATKVLSRQYDLDGVVFGVLAHPKISDGADSSTKNNGVSDENMQFAVNSLFNALAGADV